jgi:hypothetical protein
MISQGLAPGLSLSIIVSLLSICDAKISKGRTPARYHLTSMNRQLVNTQNYVFYFESDIAKIYPFRPTFSFSDSERKTKSKGELKRTRKESEQIWQTWINSMGGL